MDTGHSTMPPIGRCHLKFVNAIVIDGSGAAARQCDVAVESDRIAAVGELSDWVADETIDAGGNVLAPGFIDVHTHDDLAALKTPDMTFKVSQGVTTVVAGNCGISLAPFDATRGFPAPFPVVGQARDFRFGRVADYRSELERSPPALNLALLAGHSSMRVTTLGEDLAREATQAEIRTMTSTLREALQDGCIGLSTGLDYPPARHSTTDEVVELTTVLNEFENRVYTSHIRNEGDRVLESVEEALDIGRRGKASVVISHHKCSGPRNYGRSIETLAAIERGRQSQAVSLDVYPYTASSTALMGGGHSVNFWAFRCRRSLTQAPTRLRTSNPAGRRSSGSLPASRHRAPGDG